MSDKYFDRNLRLSADDKVWLDKLDREIEAAEAVVEDLHLRRKRMLLSRFIVKPGDIVRGENGIVYQVSEIRSAEYGTISGYKRLKGDRWAATAQRIYGEWGKE